MLHLLVGLWLSAHAAEPLPTPPSLGRLIVDAKVPTDVAIDGQRVAQVYFPAVLEFQVAPGKHAATITVGGNAEQLTVTVPEIGSTRVLVGRTGITTSLDESAVPVPTSLAHVPIEIRVSGTATMQLRVDKDRYVVGAGEVRQVTLPPGNHAISVRSADGTAIWAHGNLDLRGPEPVVLQLSEGRLPEVTGDGNFRAGS